MRTTIRLTFLQHRVGFTVLLGGALVVLLVAMAGVAWANASELFVCLGAQNDPSRLTAEQVARLERICPPAGEIAGVLAIVIVGGGNAVPLVGAVLLAAPLVASEVESTTATLAWTLAPSRRAWLLPRVAVVVGTAVTVGLVIGILLNWLMALLWPTADPWATMTALPIRGLMLPARTALVVAAALFAGCMTGRQVPALVLGVALAGALALGLFVLDQQINRANAVSYSGPGELYDSFVVDGAGNVVDWEESTTEFEMGDPRWEERYDWVNVGIPDREAPAIVARNIATHGAVVLALLAGSVALVNRRRPY